MDIDAENLLAELSDSSIKVNHTDSDEETSTPSKKRKISFNPNPRAQNKKLFSDLRCNLKKIMPTVFEKDKERASCIFNLICDIIRMNTLIDTVDDMRCVEFLITEQRIKRALSHFFSVGKPANDDTNNGILTFMSPYKEQFFELSELGSGGFGKVYQAKHKLDGVTYAIKKIKMKAQNKKQIDQTLQEVRTLAQLHHPNIVAYKQAWIELETRTQTGSGSSQSSSSFGSESNLTSVNAGFEYFNIVVDKRCKSLYTREQQDSSQDSSEHEKEPVLILYIQMNLCNLNLREWMNKRIKPSSASDIDKITMQVLSGLNYIHDLNIAHHDINPNNIFILRSSDDPHNIQVQIGDFGLACVLNNNRGDNIHSQEFGTNPYVAPEQSAKICDPKSDIYSFGIVLFELVVRMTSGMERSLKIQDLKNGILPISLMESYIEYREIILSTVIKDSTKRPSAKSLLESMRRNNDLKMEKLKDDIEKLKEENRIIRTMFTMARDKRFFISPSQSTPAHRE